MQVKPEKNPKIPKYAALLAAAAVLPLLTGCGITIPRTEGLVVNEEAQLSTESDNTTETEATL